MGDAMDTTPPTSGGGDARPLPAWLGPAAPAVLTAEAVAVLSAGGDEVRALGGGRWRWRPRARRPPVADALPVPFQPILLPPSVAAAAAPHLALELVWSVARGALSPDAATGAARSWAAAGDDCRPALSRALADALWAVWAQLEAAEEEEGAPSPSPCAAARSRVAATTTALLATPLLARPDLLRAADGTLLAAAGAVPDGDAWRKREVRANTRAAYTQHKHNLLREDGEGWAKLLTLLFGLEDGSDAAAVSATADAVTSLIGAFDLDPHRAADAVLDAVQERPGAMEAALPGLLAPFSAGAVAHALGARVRRAAAAAAAGLPPASDSGLWPVAAAMVDSGLVPLDALWPHLSPDDGECAAAGAAAQTALAAAAAAVGRISLVDADGDKDKERDPKAGAGLSSARMTLDARPLAALAAGGDDGGRANQKLALLAALLERRSPAAAASAASISSGLRAAGLDPAAHPPVAGGRAAGALACLASVPGAAPPGAPRSLGAGSTAAASAASAADFPEPAFGDLLALGPHLFHSPPLLASACRLFSAVVAGNLERARGGDAGARAALARADDLLARALLPATSLCPANPATAAQLWACLAPLPYADRFRAFAAHRAATAASPLLSAAARLAVVETRKILRRLHAPADRRDRRDALAPFGRMLGKAAAGAPLAVVAAVVAQAEPYPNMIDPCVDALRYAGPLALDCLTFVLIDRLASSGRPKLKEDGVNIADWLAALASLAGTLCRRYDGVDVRALCQYVANTLKESDPYDTLVLSELVATMAGIPPTPDLSEGQVAALAGGPTLVEAALSLSTGSRAGGARARARGAARLAAALTAGGPAHALAVPLFILLAQQRHAVAVTTASPHIKLIAELYDKTHETAVQYARFLAGGAIPPAVLAASLPSLDALTADHGVDVELAFDVWRPLLPSASPAAVKAAAAGKQQKEKEAVAGEDGELEDGEAAAAKAGDAAAPTTTTASPLACVGAAGLTWDAFLAQVERCAPPRAWRSLTPAFFATFWRLTLHDIVFPGDAYAAEKKRLTAALAAKRRAVATAEAERAARDRPVWRGGAWAPPEDVRALEEDVKAAKKEATRLADTVAALDAEAAAHRARVAAVHAGLAADAPTWLAGVPDPAGTVATFLERCVLPRVLHSPADAAFAAAFARLVHSLRTPGFSTLLYYDRTLKDVLPAILASTDAEAARLGVFLRDTLAPLETWRTDAAAYEAECAGAPGFAADLGAGAGGAPTPRADFVRLCHKWQHRAARAFRDALGTGQHVHARAALLVLNACVRTFPCLAGVAASLKRAAEKVRESTDREDVKTLANMYVMALTREAASGRMLTQEAFGGGAKAGVRPASAARPGKKGPPPAAATATLRPDAKEFVPGQGKGTAPAGGQGPARPAARAAPPPRPPPPAGDRKRDRGPAAPTDGDREAYVPPAKRARADGGTLRGEAPPAPVPRGGDDRARGGRSDREPGRSERDPAPKRGRDDSPQRSEHSSKRARGGAERPRSREATPPRSDADAARSRRRGGRGDKDERKDDRSKDERGKDERGGGSERGGGGSDRGGARSDRGAAPRPDRGRDDRDRRDDRRDDRRRDERGGRAASPVRFAATRADTDKATRAPARRRGGGGGDDRKGGGGRRRQ